MQYRSLSVWDISYIVSLKYGQVDSNSQPGTFTLFSRPSANFDFGKMLLQAFRANSVRYSRLTETKLCTLTLATPGADNYYLPSLLPIKVYLACLTAALLTNNRLEWARQPLAVPGYLEYSFLLGHIDYQSTKLYDTKAIPCQPLCTKYLQS